MKTSVFLLLVLATLSPVVLHAQQGRIGSNNLSPKKAVPPGWTAHDFPEVGYRIAVPHSARRDESDEMRTISTARYSFRDDDVQYASYFEDYLAREKPMDDATMYKSLLSLVQNSYSGEGRTVKNITYRGHKGYEYEYQLVEYDWTHPDKKQVPMTFRSRLFLVGDVVWSLTAFYKETAANKQKTASLRQRALGFLNSFDWLSTPGRKMFGVLENYKYTNPQLGFSVKFQERPAEYHSWQFTQYGVSRPFNISKEFQKVRLFPLLEKDGGTELFNFTDFNEERFTLKARWYSTQNVSADGLRKLADREVAKERTRPGAVTGQSICIEMKGHPACFFAFSVKTDSDERWVQRYFIKVSDSGYLWLDWETKDDSLNEIISGPFRSIEFLEK